MFVKIRAVAILLKFGLELDFRFGVGFIELLVGFELG